MKNQYTYCLWIWWIYKQNNTFHSACWVEHWRLLYFIIQTSTGSWSLLPERIVLSLHFVSFNIRILCACSRKWHKIIFLLNYAHFQLGEIFLWYCSFAFYVWRSFHKSHCKHFIGQICDNIEKFSLSYIFENIEITLIKFQYYEAFSAVCESHGSSFRYNLN